MTFLIMYLLIGFLVTCSLNTDYPIADVIVGLIWPVGVIYGVYLIYEDKKDENSK